MAGEEGRFGASESTDPHEEILAPLREAYDGRIAAFPVGRHGLIVFRPMTGTEHRTFKRKMLEIDKKATDQKLTPQAIEDLTEFETVEMLLRQCVHPADKERARAIIDDYPRMVQTVVVAIGRISGAGVEELGKG